MAASKGSAGTELVVSVPQGGQVIRTFNLTPSLPVDGKAGDWLWADPSAPTTLISTVNVKFNVESTAVEQDFERAVLIINMQQNSKENGYWRFALDGLAINPEYKDIYHNAEFEIVENGETLVAYIQVVGNTRENIKFSFVASYADSASGVVGVYQSADPDIGIGRP